MMSTLITSLSNMVTSSYNLLRENPIFSTGNYIINVIVIACFIISSTFVWKMLNFLFFTPKRLEKLLRQQGLQGNTYRFFFGDLKDDLRMISEAKRKPLPFTNDYSSRVSPFQHQQVHKYGGRTYITWMGPIPTIYITDPQLINGAFTRINEFQKPKGNPHIESLIPGLLSLEGEKWAMHRKLVNPTFHMEKLKLMLPSLYISIIDTMNKWEKMTSETGIVEIDVWPHLENLTCDALARAAFGRTCYEDGLQVFKLLMEQIQLISTSSMYKFGFPGITYVPTKTNRRMKEINSKVQITLMNLIEKRNKAREGGEAATDLLGILMDLTMKERQNNNHVMGAQDLIDECKEFYFAGQLAPPVVLVWTLILLSKHQNWQVRAREEVLTTFGNNQPDYSGLSRLKTVTMILHEVLRLYPPAIELYRKVYENETKLGDLFIPKGAMVCLPVLQMHQNTTLWGDDAKDFKPERFSEGIANATKGKLIFFPFGWGPRMCVGQNLALLEIKMVLVMILQRFSFELSPSYTHAPLNVFTLQPEYGAHLILQRL